MPHPHQHFFLEERDETIVSTKDKLHYKVNTQYLRENVCCRVLWSLRWIWVAKCNGCDFSECVVNKVK